MAPDRRALHIRLRRLLTKAGAVLLGIALLIWTLLPVYNMLLIALDPEEGEVEFSGNLWPPEPSLESFRVVLTEDARYLEHFWRQLANSLYIGLSTMFLTVVIASLASFAVGRMRLGAGSLLTSVSLLTYAIPASFLIFPFHRIMHGYGLSNDPWAVIAAQVTFATPFAIWILRNYFLAIPHEMEESARIDGASPLRTVWSIILPQAWPGLFTAGIFTFTACWTEFLMALTFNSSNNFRTIPVGVALFGSQFTVPYGVIFAASVVAVVPIGILVFVFRRSVVSGLTAGAVKG